MTDKVQKIKEYLVGMAGAAFCDAKTKKVIKENILPFIDSLQEEPVVQCVPFEPVGVPVDKVVPANIPDKKEEPVSDDLEKEFERIWDDELSGKIDTKVAKHIARHFANWQRQKDQKWIDDNRQQIFNEGYKNGSYAGRYDMYNRLFEAASTDRVVTHFLLAHSV